MNECKNREGVCKQMHVVKQRNELKKAGYMGANAGGLVDEMIGTSRSSFLYVEGEVDI